MMFIVRTEQGQVPDLDVRMVRRTPAIVTDSAGRIDCFCAGDLDAARAAGWPTVPVHDGWYPDDHGGGVAIWGQGLFWEVRDTPFSVRQASGPTKTAAAADDAAVLDVRGAIFGGGV
ncbi:hypothetical protein [Rhodopila sp.]|uniref:hypothetical protein n=1 Tax=Rhodopila sp. TaxID=2480087 RepID=UPI003D1146B8